MDKEIKSFKDLKGRLVFICEDLTDCPSAWNFCKVSDYTKAPSFQCYNASFNYAWYSRYCVLFEDFNPYDMEETIKHVIDAAYLPNE